MNLNPIRAVDYLRGIGRVSPVALTGRAYRSIAPCIDEVKFPGLLTGYGDINLIPSNVLLNTIILRFPDAAMQDNLKRRIGETIKANYGKRGLVDVFYGRYTGFDGIVSKLQGKDFGQRPGEGIGYGIEIIPWGNSIRVRVRSEDIRIAKRMAVKVARIHQGLERDKVQHKVVA